MKKVTAFNRQNIRQINSELEAALKQVAEKYGLEVKLGNTRFTGDNFTTKVQVATVGEGGITMSKEATDFNRYKTILGINMELGQEFERSGKTYTIVGLKPRSKKYPILAKCSDSKTYKLPVDLVNMYA
jgi:hypothetical protein